MKQRQRILAGSNVSRFLAMSGLPKTGNPALIKRVPLAPPFPDRLPSPTLNSNDEELLDDNS